MENIEAENSKKYNGPTPLAVDIKTNGFECKNITFEVGSWGQTLQSKSKLFKILEKHM